MYSLHMSLRTQRESKVMIVVLIDHRKKDGSMSILP